MANLAALVQIRLDIRRRDRRVAVDDRYREHFVQGGHGATSMLG